MRIKILIEGTKNGFIVTPMLSDHLAWNSINFPTNLGTAVYEHVDELCGKLNYILKTGDVDELGK